VAFLGHLVTWCSGTSPAVLPPVSHSVALAVPQCCVVIVAGSIPQGCALWAKELAHCGLAWPPVLERWQNAEPLKEVQHIVHTANCDLAAACDLLGRLLDYARTCITQVFAHSLPSTEIMRNTCNLVYCGAVLVAFHLGIRSQPFLENGPKQIGPLVGLCENCAILRGAGFAPLPRTCLL
jgi:hypothetical protein